MENENIEKDVKSSNDNNIEDKLVTSINTKWKRISNEWTDIKSQKFEEEYIKNIKERIAFIAQASVGINKKIENLEKYISKNL